MKSRFHPLFRRCEQNQQLLALVSSSGHVPSTSTVSGALEQGSPNVDRHLTMCSAFSKPNVPPPDWRVDTLRCASGCPTCPFVRATDQPANRRPCSPLGSTPPPPARYSRPNPSTGSSPPSWTVRLRSGHESAPADRLLALPLAQLARAPRKLYLAPPAPTKTLSVRIRTTGSRWTSSSETPGSVPSIHLASLGGTHGPAYPRESSHRHRACSRNVPFGCRLR